MVDDKNLDFIIGIEKLCLHVVDAMLPVTAKLAFILKLDLVNTQVFHL